MTLALSLSLALGAFVPQQAGSAPLADPALEARVQHLGKQLRCTVCQGMSIADAPAQMARSQMDKVRELVGQGKSDQEVLDYFVQRYDEWVLLSPPRQGFSLLVWVGPVAVLLLGLLFVAWYVRGRQRAASAAPVPPLPSSAALGGAAEDPYLQAVRSEVER